MFLPASVACHSILVCLILIGYYTTFEPMASPYIRVEFLTPQPLPPAAASAPENAAPTRPKVTVVPDLSVEEFQDPVQDWQDFGFGETMATGETFGAGEAATPDAGGSEGGIAGGVPGGAEYGSVLNLVAAGLIGDRHDASYGEAASVEVNDTMTYPYRIRTAKPLYPAILKRGHIEGIVLLRVIISEKGDVEDIAIVRPLHPVLDRCAVDAVRRWKYRPARVGKTAIRVFQVIAVKFSVDSRDAAGW